MQLQKESLLLMDLRSTRQGYIFLRVSACRQRFSVPRRISRTFESGPHRSSLRGIFQRPATKTVSHHQLNPLTHTFARYVQHLIREHAAEVWNLIGKGDGHFYISGSADKMPKDVRAALAEVLMREGQMNEEGADLYIKKMEQTKRYQVETWAHQ